ncbi:MAG: hypothetical protein WC729_29540 [Sphingomonas sp.]|jgi:hypothetical protein|uniref:hypothetical protein n=1 Tax=Sphingomonas sp. TaxID=28214 RepID=UPI0035657AB6
MFIEVTEVYVSQSEKQHRFVKVVYNDKAIFKVRPSFQSGDVKSVLVFKDLMTQDIAETVEEFLVKARGFDPASITSMVNQVVGTMFPAPEGPGAKVTHLRPGPTPEEMDQAVVTGKAVVGGLDAFNAAMKAQVPCVCGEVCLSNTAASLVSGEYGTHAHPKNSFNKECNWLRGPGVLIAAVTHVCVHCQKQFHAVAGVSVCHVCKDKGLK